MNKIDLNRNDLLKTLVSYIRKEILTNGSLIFGLDFELLVPNHNINIQDEYSRYIPIYCRIKGKNLEVECYVREHEFQQFEDCDTDVITVSGDKYNFYSMLLANYIYDHIQEKKNPKN